MRQSVKLIKSESEIVRFLNFQKKTIKEMFKRAKLL